MSCFGHGGTIRAYEKALGVNADAIRDYSANINPLGQPDWLRDVVSCHVASLAHYPDPENTDLLEALSCRFSVPPSHIMAGNGSSELLHLIPKALAVTRAVIPVPAYLDYEVAARAAGLHVLHVKSPESTGFRPDLAEIGAVLKKGDIVYIGHPVNPSGAVNDPEELRTLAASHPDVFFVIDEAFLDFVDEGKSLVPNRPENVLVSVSFTKMFAIPGIRLGMIVGKPELLEAVRALQPCWSVNRLAQEIGIRAAEDLDWPKQTRKVVDAARKEMEAALRTISGLTVFPGSANYLLLKIENGRHTAASLKKALFRDHIAIRDCSNYAGLGDAFFRLAVKLPEENRIVVDAIKKAFGAAPGRKKEKKTPAIMFQGTCSNAGKSILTAAFARILLEDGISVAPFKAQNMALNSHVTKDGFEMGRAQVLQAQAARLEPDCRMNPVLLKPNSDIGSQVVVNGKPVGNMKVAEYIQYKPTAFRAIQDAYDSLSSEYDAMVIEGAGSPAEVNLKAHDIVNMAVAHYAKAPVLLIGDIDRGGVFASLVGTMEVLPEEDRRQVAGFLVNKFRGDASLLDPAFEFMKRRTGKPVLGVVPHVRFNLPEEDSVGLTSHRYNQEKPEGDFIDLAVIDLPHVANFTDIDPFLEEPDVHLRLVKKATDLGTPDAILIPGSKNVMKDAAFLKASGLVDAIRNRAGNGTPVVGICAGFQLLGKSIEDPHGIESTPGDAISGLGLLSMETVLEEEKTLTKVTATHPASGLALTGYEIHHGAMRNASGAASVIREDGTAIGLACHTEDIWGTYLHGLFDADAFRRHWIDTVRKKKGLAPEGKILYVHDVESEIAKLAAAVRASMDVSAIYHSMGLG